jgi:hypothetical protein
MEIPSFLYFIIIILLPEASIIEPSFTIDNAGHILSSVSIILAYQLVFVLRSVRGSYRAGKSFLDIRLLLRIRIHAKSQADFICHFFFGKYFGQEFADQLFIVVLMRAVQQERVSALPTSDSADPSRQLPNAYADAAQHEVAKLPPILLVD